MFCSIRRGIASPPARRADQRQRTYTPSRQPPWGTLRPFVRVDSHPTQYSCPLFICLLDDRVPHHGGGHEVPAAIVTASDESHFLPPPHLSRRRRVSARPRLPGRYSMESPGDPTRPSLQEPFALPWPTARRYPNWPHATDELLF